MKMEPDDGIRGDDGLVVSLRELPTGKLRLTIDDVERIKVESKTDWRHRVFVTHKDYEEMDLRKIDFPEQELADFGYYVLARLLAASGKFV